MKIHHLLALSFILILIVGCGKPAPDSTTGNNAGNTPVASTPATPTPPVVIAPVAPPAAAAPVPAPATPPPARITPPPPDDDDTPAPAAPRPKAPTKSITPPAENNNGDTVYTSASGSCYPPIVAAP